jgi:hypothetical protein
MLESYSQMFFMMRVRGVQETTSARGGSRGGGISIVIPDTLLESYSQNDKCSNQRRVCYKIHMNLKRLQESYTHLHNY